MNDRSNASQINVTQMTSMADLAITLLDDNIIMFNSIFNFNPGTFPQRIFH